MNKKMRELLARIEAKTAEARSAQDANELEKSATLLDEIDELRKQYDVEKRLFEAEQTEVPETPEQADKGMTDEEKSFMDYCAGKAATSLSAGNNGAIIPTTIANKIIEQVKELSPIVQHVTTYNVTGNLVIPTYGPDSADDVKAAYNNEFTELTEHAGKFGSVELGSNIVGALTKVSRKLTNNAGIDALSFIIQHMGTAFTDFFEKELLVGDGTSGHMTGAIKTTNVKETAVNTLAGITADLLIDAQLTVPQIYQPNAMWIMHKDVLAAVRKLKDKNDDYLLTRSLVEGFTWELLGKPVYVSDNMPKPAANTVPVIYGDMSGMAFKIAKGLEVQVLNEKYATQYATGVVGWAEVDSKIENAQKFVAIKIKNG